MDRKDRGRPPSESKNINKRLKHFRLMLPRWHIILGEIFTLFIWIFIPKISLLNLALIFFSSFLIDFDHYIASGLKSQKWKLSDSFEYHRLAQIQQAQDIEQGIKKKGDFHFFHTLEFHGLVGILGIFIPLFFYIFLGMIFHSMLDIIDLLRTRAFHRREYFFFNWTRKKI